ncbi:hypothetical protein MTR67_045289 [Solanum verrucosum]|uniref:Josephin-like protein n=1 Tax=Solanum verrucosum TaxID=315347 RepID=A0AAF0ZWU9_SOLVR|nr:hypothetical protein MTR67_045289 [Solanum verrucosum]
MNISHNKSTKLFSTNKKPTSSSIWSTFQSSSSSSGFSPVSFLKDIGTKVGSALNFFSKSNYTKRNNSRKVVSSTNLARSSSYHSQTFDSQRVEAIEDCIHFLNLNSSSNSLKRSNSIS